MSGCAHEWEMANVVFGFVVFERCSHCMSVRTFFSPHGSTSEEYREGACTWGTVENAQSLRFDMRCRKCGAVEGFSELMGLLYCTECMPECEVLQLQERLRAQKTWLIVAFGYLPAAQNKPLPAHKLEVLTAYFNQHRDVSRSTIKVVPFEMIKTISQCRGEFIHDVGVLSLEPEEARKQLL